MISVENLTVEFGGSPLFDEIGFLVNPKDKIALVGKNGAGKTTLLRIFAGQQLPTRGNAIIPKDISCILLIISGEPFILILSGFIVLAVFSAL